MVIGGGLLTVSEFCSIMDELHNSDLSYSDKLRKAKKASVQHFMRCWTYCSLVGNEQYVSSVIADTENDKEAADKLCTSKSEIERVVGIGWRSIHKYASLSTEEISKEFAKYFIALVECSTGSRVERIKLLRDRDAYQFACLVRSMNLTEEEEFVLYSVTNKYSICCSVEPAQREMLYRVHDTIYGRCVKVLGA